LVVATLQALGCEESTMRPPLLFCPPTAAVSALAVSLFALPSVLRWAAEPQALTEQQQKANRASFDQVWKTVNDKHYDPKLGGLDWQAVRDELRPRVEQAKTMPQVRAVLRDMLGRLKQSHFEIFPAGEYEERDSAASEGGRDGTTGIHARVVDGKALVTRVEAGSAAAHKGVRPGWEIRQLNGEELAPVIAAINKRHEGSPLLSSKLAWLAMAPLSGKLGEQVSVRFLDGEGRVVPVEIPFAQRPGHKHRSGNLPPRYIRLESRRVGETIGYVTFNSWIDPDYLTKAFDDTLKTFNGGRGLVIDLRGARGGLGHLPAVFAGRLVKEPKQNLGTMTLRQGKFTFAITPREQTFDAPVAILVDGLTRSASETFAGGLQDLGRARVFGSRTAGAVLPAVVDRLPNGDSFQYAVADFHSPKGKRLEGVGVVPDVEVVPKREELLAGRDPVLVAAVAWIRRQK
jgi:carboxyl-terminal processing protease